VPRLGIEAADRDALATVIALGALVALVVGLSHVLR
jgi:hypothetical protein